MSDLKYDILSIQERAVAKQHQGHKVINGCAGMLFDDDKKLCGFNEVNQKIKDNFTDFLAYPAVLGPKEYRDGVLKWLFDEQVDKLEELYAIAFSVTLGGTGALSMLFHQTAAKGGIALFSNIRWPNYDTIAKENYLNFDLYNFIKNGCLDINDISAKISGLLVEHQHIILIINDPCHNPLGYCMSDEDYKGLFDLLSKFNGKVSLVLDIAYIDYDPLEQYYKKYILNMNNSFPIHLIFSCSKSFGLYGLRLGALISLLPKDSDLNSHLEEMRAYARGTYSCANNGAIGPMSIFFHDEISKKTVREKLSYESSRLKVIGSELVKILDDLNIKHYPYKGGFYLTFEADDSIHYCQMLENKDIYFAPIDDKHIRIAVSGLNLLEIAEIKRRLTNE